MSDTKIALLDDRGVVRVSGEDATAFLDNLVTQDVTGMAEGEARFAALLTPQGKILFDFFVVRTVDGYLLDVARGKAAELVKRLTLYKLRAKVAIDDMSNYVCTWVIWASGDMHAIQSNGSITTFPSPVAAYQEPRQPIFGMVEWRHIIDVAQSETTMAMAKARQIDVGDYRTRRISLGIPEGGKDYAFGDAFPHEVNMDRLNGVSFTKGCFVGQEVVARMQHKTVVRKRIVKVTGAAPLMSGAAIKVGEATIGAVGSVAGNAGLAMLRLDRVIEANDKGQAITSDGQPLTVDGEPLELYRAESAAKAEVKAARI